MYRNRSFIVIAPCFNEAKKIGSVVERVRATKIADEVLVVDDGSNDGSQDVAKSKGATVLALGKTYGVGYALREGFRYAKEKKIDLIVVIAGNNKDEPKEIPLLLDPIIEGRARFVQGSRFLKGGGYQGMPTYRQFATRFHPWLFSCLTGAKLTESTNGFRAFETNLLEDPRIRLDQEWLDGYELEPYLLYKVVSLRIPSCEVPVTKIYPPKNLGYTKIRPFIDWWNLLKPLLLLKLGVRS